LLFNSIDFTIFLPIVFSLYWLINDKSLKLQNILIVASSYIFYGWWDWRFLSLIFCSTAIDYLIGTKLKNENLDSKRKILLWTSIIVNIGFLGFFKYYNFFLESFTSAFSFFGAEITSNSLNIILPVGISFYTFQTLSYTIDVYKRKIEPTNDFISFAAFVSFFPQLVAGPIERASHLLPQFYKRRSFDHHKAVDGIRQILWGLFKKVVIADNAAEIANIIFNNSDNFNGSTLILGSVMFSFQIYGDFSGYSDIAIGTSRLFGFDLKQNFATPYFSRSIAEFWRRWHISLSSWFRDYLYIPLGGGRGGNLMRIRNTFIIFVVSGFWHGANWTFIIWGVINACYILPSIVLRKNRNNLDIVAAERLLPSYKEFSSILITFFLTVLAWVFFRSDNINHALQIMSHIFSMSLFDPLEVKPLFIIALILFFTIIEWFGRFGEYGLQKIFVKQPVYMRWSFYFILIFCIILFSGKAQEFIYFQF